MKERTKGWQERVEDSDKNFYQVTKPIESRSLSITAHKMVFSAKEMELSDGRVSQILSEFKSKFTKNSPQKEPESLQIFNIWNFSVESRHGVLQFLHIL